jgi:hypothetical protein
MTAADVSCVPGGLSGLSRLPGRHELLLVDLLLVVDLLLLLLPLLLLPTLQGEQRSRQLLPGKAAVV